MSNSRVLPTINSYGDLKSFNKDLIASNKNLPELNLEGADFNKNLIKVNGEAHFVDEFLYNYVVNKTGILTGKVAGLSRYDFTRLNYLLHPEGFKGQFVDYINNLILMGLTECSLWDFTICKESNDIILKKCNNKKAIGVFIPAFITKIGANAFNNQNINKVIIEEGSGLKIIETGAFNGCKKLTKINLQEGLVYIGSEAFKDTQLKEIIIPSSVNILDKSAFNGCIELEKVVIKSNSQLNHIGDTTFENCVSLRAISLPSSLMYIGKGAFSCCREIKEIKIPDSVRTLKDYAFGGCKKLEKAVLGRKIKRINKALFTGCKSLKEFIPLGNIDKIDFMAFGGCGLTEIVIPSSVKEIGLSAFLRCAKLKRVHFNKGSMLETMRDSVFHGCTALEKINLPSSLKVMGSGIFFECTSLRDVEIPDSINEIGTSLFSNCSQLKNVTIGKGIKVIPSWTFKQCTSLRKVVLLGDIEEIATDAFMDTNEEELKIYIPKRQSLPIESNYF